MEFESVKAILRRSISLKRFMRWRYARGGYPDWGEIAAPEELASALVASRNGPKILIATGTGGFIPGALLEGLLSASLTLRGANVHALLCDHALPACQEALTTWYSTPKAFVKSGPQKSLCNSCFAPAEKMFRSLGVSVHRYSDNIEEMEMLDAERISSSLPFDEIAQYRMDGLSVGEHALAGALRFFASGTLDREPCGEAVLRRYFHASLLTVYAVRRLIRKLGVSKALFHHGIYVPQGLVGEVARSEKVDVVNWNVAYKKRCFIFSHGDSYHHTLMSEPVDRWENMEWTARKDETLMRYLESRAKGTNDWIWFHHRPVGDLRAIEKELGIDLSKPAVGLLTNVCWDAQLHYPANAFPNMLDWIVRTIDYFRKRPDLSLVIRVHPAEIRGAIPSRQRVADEIARRFDRLPSNVVVVPPESRINTYAAMSLCNAVIIYGTKTGVELSSMGIPVIVAGEAWVRNKGITRDAATAEEYFRILDELPFAGRMDPATVLRAKKYAYHFFFRRMIPVSSIEPTGSWPPFKLNIDDIDRLSPGNDRGLDVICDAILKGSDFIHDAKE